MSDADQALALALAAVISPLRRSLLRAAKQAESLPDIPDAQIELLRWMPIDQAVSPGQLAAVTGLRRPTISNVLRTMEADGLVTRERSAADARCVEVRASRHARDLLDRYDRASRDVVARCLRRLNDSSTRALANAADALAQLADELAVIVAEPLDRANRSAERN